MTWTAAHSLRQVRAVSPIQPRGGTLGIARPSCHLAPAQKRTEGFGYNFARSHAPSLTLPTANDLPMFQSILSRVRAPASAPLPVPTEFLKGVLAADHAEVKHHELTVRELKRILREHACSLTPEGKIDGEKDRGP